MTSVLSNMPESYGMRTWSQTLDGTEPVPPSEGPLRHNINRRTQRNHAIQLFGHGVGQANASVRRGKAG